MLHAAAAAAADVDDGGNRCLLPTTPGQLCTVFRPFTPPRQMSANRPAAAARCPRRNGGKRLHSCRALGGGGVCQGPHGF